MIALSSSLITLQTLFSFLFTYKYLYLQPISISTYGHMLRYYTANILLNWFCCSAFFVDCATFISIIVYWSKINSGGGLITTISLGSNSIVTASSFGFDGWSFKVWTKVCNKLNYHLHQRSIYLSSFPINTMPLTKGFMLVQNR